ncbi:MAG: HAD family phosphatase [Chlamydiota bacterium]
MQTKCRCAVIKAVLFDCDGTLVDSEYTHYLSWQYALQQLGGDLSLEEYYSYVGKSSAVIAEQMAEKLTRCSADAILMEKRGYYQALHSSGLPLIVPTVEFLLSLLQEKERLDLKIGVCSAAKKTEVSSHVERLGIGDRLDVVLSGQEDLVGYSDPEGVNKPKPYIYQHAMKLLNVSPHECVVIEDSASGVRAGVDAGCFTIAVPNEYTLRHDLSHAHLRVDSFAGISIDQFFQMVSLKNRD